jgi:hypothetical protein
MSFDASPNKTKYQGNHLEHIIDRHLLQNEHSIPQRKVLDYLEKIQVYARPANNPASN